jgi:hypothetical protein
VGAVGMGWTGHPISVHIFQQFDALSGEMTSFNQTNGSNYILPPQSSHILESHRRNSTHGVSGPAKATRASPPAQLLLGTRLASGAFRSSITRLHSPGRIASTSRVRFGSFAVMIACAASISPLPLPLGETHPSARPAPTATGEIQQKATRPPAPAIRRTAPARLHT